MLTTLNGFITDFVLTPANIDGRDGIWLINPSIFYARDTLNIFVTIIFLMAKIFI